MKFIHAADIHLGCQPDRGSEWSKERSFDILSAFRNLINACKEEEPDILMIAGDLFHRQPTEADLKEAASLFLSIPNIPVVIIAGNHDCVRAGSALDTYSWPENVWFLSGSGMQTAEFKSLRTVVHGFSYHSREITEPLYDGIKAPEDDNFHILLAHGGDEKHIPVDRKALAKAGFSYIALGHIHKPEIDIDDRLAYAGSLSPVTSAETGEHGYIVGELTGSGTGSLSLKFVPLKSRSYIPCRVKVTSRTTNQSLFSTVTNFIKQYGTENIYKLTLVGQRDPDIVFDEGYIRTCGRIVSFNDKTVPFYDIEELIAEHSHDLIGSYISSFLDDDTEDSLTDPVKKQAFYYGLSALLNNFDTGDTK